MGPDLEVLPVDVESSDGPHPAPILAGRRLSLFLLLLVLLSGTLAIWRESTLRSAKAALAEARTSAAESERGRQAALVQLRSAEAVARALRGAQTTTTSTAPASKKSVFALQVTGDAIRGTSVSVAAAGVPPNTELDLVLAPIDGYGSLGIGSTTSDADGKAIFSAFVPQYVSHEGPCRTEQGCDYLPVDIGPHVLTVFPRNSTTIVAQGELRIVRAQVGVAYAVASSGECGPQRVDLDGRTWIADDPSDFVPPNGLTLVRGTIVLTSSSSAQFTSDAGRRGTLRPTSSGFFC